MLVHFASWVTFLAQAAPQYGIYWTDVIKLTETGSNAIYFKVQIK